MVDSLEDVSYPGMELSEESGEAEIEEVFDTEEVPEEKGIVASSVKCFVIPF